MSTKVVSFRVKPEELAKALEGLIERNTDPDNLMTISNIVRTTFYHGIIALCKDPNAPVSQEIMRKVNQLSFQNKRIKNPGIAGILDS